jgi:signal transduction histidine kinase
MNRRSIGFRLVSWYCALLLLLYGASALYTYTYFDHYIAETTQATLAARATAIWEISQGMLNDRQALETLIEQRFAPEAQDRFIAIQVGEKTIYRSGTPIERGFDPASVPIPPTGAKPGVFRDGELIVLSRRFMLPGGTPATVFSGSSLDPIVAAETRLAAALLIGMPLLLVIAAAGGYWLVNRALAPVKAMIAAAEALTFNSPHNRLPPAETGDDIDALGRTLNRMLDRLDHAYQHASRFSADAAHELRTPLSIMRGELELLASRRGLPTDVQIALGNILDEAARLAQIVGSLTALSHLDSIAGKRSHLAVDLGGLAAETIDQMRLMADEKSISMKFKPSDVAFAAGDRDRLKQLLVNLLDNAIKYTLPGGSISVSVAIAEDNVVLTVADSGIGIDPENFKQIFERFFRVATDRGELGAGLGLAIVRAICIAHGGTVTAEGAPGAGSVFRVVLPRAPTGLIAATVRRSGDNAPRDAEIVFRGADADAPMNEVRK